MSEKSEIKRDNARAQKNSGRGQIQKGDAILGPFLYDIKEYEKSFSISRSVWAKVCGDAFRSGRRIPAIKLVLGKGNSKVRLWIIDEDMFNEMREAYESARGTI